MNINFDQSTTSYKMCDYQLIERKVFEKSLPFDPKTMPITDYWQKFECQECGKIKTETGFIVNGQDQNFGTAASFLGCGEVVS